MALRFSERVITTCRTAPRSSIWTSPMYPPSALNPEKKRLMDIKKVGVAGLGLMGHGIAQVAAQAGYEVVAREVDDAALQKGIGKIEKQLGRAVEKGRLEQSAADEIRGRIKTTTGFDGFEDCDLVIEAITERLELKI